MFKLWVQVGLLFTRQYILSTAKTPSTTATRIRFVLGMPSIKKMSDRPRITPAKITVTATNADYLKFDFSAPRKATIPPKNITAPSLLTSFTKSI